MSEDKLIKGIEIVVQKGDQLHLSHPDRFKIYPYEDDKQALNLKLPITIMFNDKEVNDWEDTANSSSITFSDHNSLREFALEISKYVLSNLDLTSQQKSAFIAALIQSKNNEKQ